MIIKVKKIIVGCVLLLSFSITFTPILIDSLLLIIASILSALVLYKEKKSVIKFFKTYYFLLAFYLILIIGLSYSENLSKGFNQLEKKLTFIILPFIFFSIKETIKSKQVITFFCYGVLFGAIFCDLNALINQGVFLQSSYSNLLSPLDIDPTYMSMYCLLSIVFFFNDIQFNTTIIKRFINVFILLYLTYFLLRLGSKIAILLILVIAILLILNKLKHKSKKEILILCAVIVVIGLISYILPITYNRFYAPILDNNLDFYQLKMKFFNERYYAWKCSIEAINLKSIWFGYGTGDDIKVLQDCYINYKREYVLNSHNIYFSSIIKTGILGLLSLLLLIFKGLKSKKIIYIGFSLIILFTGLTESLLERQKGVIFFTLICTLILTDLQIKNKDKCVE